MYSLFLIGYFGLRGANHIGLPFKLGTIEEGSATHTRIWWPGVSSRVNKMLHALLAFTVNGFITMLCPHESHPERSAGHANEQLTSTAVAAFDKWPTIKRDKWWSRWQGTWDMMFLTDWKVHSTIRGVLTVGLNALKISYQKVLDLSESKKTKNIKRVGDDVSVGWRLSYPVTNITNSSRRDWNTSTYNIALNTLLLAADLVARHKANPRTNSKTLYSGSLKIHGNRLLLHSPLHCTASSI